MTAGAVHADAESGSPGQEPCGQIYRLIAGPMRRISPPNPPVCPRDCIFDGGGSMLRWKAIRVASREGGSEVCCCVERLGIFNYRSV